MKVAGVDGCREGWVGFVLPDEQVIEGCRTFDELLAHMGPVDVIGVDMPLFAPETGVRYAEAEVIEALGPFRSSLFVTPTREALTAATQREATEINRRNGGAGVSAQAFALRHKIAEVRAVRAPLIEVHPELTFRLLGPVEHRKRSWAGIRERVAVLQAHGLHPDDWDCGNWASADDTLDAAAAALSARRYVRGEARRFGSADLDPGIFA